MIVRAQFAFAAAALFLVLAAAGTASDTPSLSLNDPLVSEPDSGTANVVFTVKLSAPAAGPVSVDWATADGSAEAPADYVAASGTLTFAAGETSKQVPVAIVGDTLDEPHETFTVNLSNPSGATLADARGIGTILDNDPPVSLSVDDVQAAEGSGSASFKVSLSSASGKVLTVAYATADESATAPADYAPAQGTLVFLAGEVEKTVEVALVDDGIVEADETFTLTLSNAVNALLGDPQGVATITNDDTTPPPADDPPPGSDPPPPPPDDPPPPPDDPPSPPDEPPSNEPPPEEPPAANAAPDCSAVAPSANRLWAPNHKFRLVTLEGASDPDGDPLSHELRGVTQDEPLRRGADARTSGWSNQVWLRAERLGKGDGRVYRLEYAASDDHGNSCRGTVLVTVPHDRAHPAAVDSGSSWSSFGL